MSFLTGTNTELIYANTAAGTAKASFTSEVAINDVAGMGAQASLPPFFFSSSPTTTGKGFAIVARGILSSTATPTYTFTLRLGAAGSTTAAIILGSAALTTGSGVTNQVWEFTGEFFIQAPAGAAGANTTGRGTGMLKSPGIASPFMAALFGGAASPGTVATIDTSITNYFNFNVTCSASSASNSIQLQQLEIFGLN
ncbi:hypothetical protein QF038_001845 [Pseudarthrobacter sp. W1I19]|uniref:hypothetical protein n=1 Tax=Pseudarthrobacter sp. W1I19 TaxID=3042288 RepID=UPI00278205D2|nr:hypothetical protein [Pseudarthrobacter sp. W1I19]MDQ0923337.1 hypothetical protein [Pseudarthrobacter sp. W1I19]